MYTPLTKEQYSNAINSGFTLDEIISMEKKKKGLIEETKDGFVLTDAGRIAIL